MELLMCFLAALAVLTYAVYRFQLIRKRYVETPLNYSQEYIDVMNSRWEEYKQKMNTNM